MGDSRAKLSYAVHVAIAEIARTSRFPTFATFSFAENVTDKAEAAVRWRRLKERMKRKLPDIRMVGVWQRQERGAWHLHVVADRYLDIHWLRPAALECGFGPQLNLKPITVPGSRGFRQNDPRDVARYITRYITRDCESEDKGVRLVDYTGSARRVTVAFSWYKGISRLWRLGRQVWSDIYGVERPTFEAYWFVVRLGWEVLSEGQQREVLEGSDAVSRWWDPERYPF